MKLSFFIRVVVVAFMSAATGFVVHADSWLPPTSCCESLTVDGEKFITTALEPDNNRRRDPKQEQYSITRIFGRKGKLASEKREIVIKDEKERWWNESGKTFRTYNKYQDEDGSVWMIPDLYSQKNGPSLNIVSLRGETRTNHALEWNYQSEEYAIIKDALVVGKHLYLILDGASHRRMKGIVKFSLETFKPLASAKLVNDAKHPESAKSSDYFGVSQMLTFGNYLYLFVYNSFDDNSNTKRLYQFSLDTLEQVTSVELPNGIPYPYPILVVEKNLYLLAEDKRYSGNWGVYKFSLDPLELSASVKLLYRVGYFTDMIAHDGKVFVAGVRKPDLSGRFPRGSSEIVLMGWDGVSDTTQNQVLSYSIDYGNPRGPAPIHLANIGADALLAWTYRTFKRAEKGSLLTPEYHQKTFAFSLDFEQSPEALDGTKKPGAARKNIDGVPALPAFPEEPLRAPSAPTTAAGNAKGYVDPDIEWLDNTLLSSDTFNDFERLEGLVGRLKEKETIERLVQITRRFAAKNVNYDQQRAAYLVTKLLAWTGTDEAVEAIAPYLRHPLPSVRNRAIADLRMTMNPKAVPYLADALREAEGGYDALSSIVETLAWIYGTDALAALDASEKRIEKMGGEAYLRSERLRSVQAARERGIRNLQREKANERLVRQALSDESPTRVETFLLLARSRDERIHKAVAENPNTSVEILALLAESSLYRIPEIVASNPKASVETLKKLYQKNELSVNGPLSQNPNTPQEILAVLAEYDNRRLSKSVAANPSTSQETLAQLAQARDGEKIYSDGNIELRSIVASNPNASVNLLAKLARDSYPMVLSAVARNPNTGKLDVERLARHHEPSIRISAASNPNISKETWRKLAQDSHPFGFYIVLGAAANPNVSREELQEFIQSPNEYARTGAASNPNVTKEDLEKLEQDPVSEVRRAALANPNYLHLKEKQ